MNHAGLDPLIGAVPGFAGGAAAELVQWFGLRFTLHKGLPDWSKSWLYWVVTVLMAVSGGGPHDSPHFHTGPKVSAKTGSWASISAKRATSGSSRVSGMVGMSS